MFLKQLNRVLQVLFFVSIPSFLAQPVLGILGLNVTPPIGGTLDTIRFLLIVGVVVFALAILLVFGLGYLVLTGWKSYRNIPFALRLALAFLMGLTVFSLADPIGLLVPIPFASVTMVTIGLWGALRSISGYTSSDELPMTITEAEMLGSSYITSRNPASKNLQPAGAVYKGNQWILQYVSESGERFEVRLDAGKRRILEMRRL